MVDLTAISALAASLRMAGDITKTAIGLRDGQMLQAKVIELQGVILAAQSSALTTQSDQFAMVEEIRALKEEIAGLKKWNTDADQYEFKQIDTNAFAYSEKAASSSGKPAHWLCVNCFDQGRRSVLVFKERTKDNRHSVHACPHCKASVVTLWSRKPGDPYPPVKEDASNS